MSLIMPLPPPWGNLSLPEYNIYLLPRSFDNRHIPSINMVAGSYYINICLHQLLWRGILQDVPLHKFIEIFQWYKILIIPSELQNILELNTDSLSVEGKKVTMNEAFEGSSYLINSYNNMIPSKCQLLLQNLCAIIRPLTNWKVDNVQNTDSIIDIAIAFLEHKLYSPPLGMSDWV
jgi:hypothetical protein